MANRQYKDSVFRAYFNRADRLASLYQAIRPSECIRPEDIEITPLDDVLFDQQKNDVSFLWNGKAIILAEHQSTVNPNMPLRMFLYSASLMLERVANRKALYGRKLVTLPAPHFYVLYIGDAMQGDETTLLFSDAFQEKPADLELTCHVINITYQEHRSILERCKPLEEYSFLVHGIEERKKQGMPLKQAIREAAQYCIQHGIMKEFLEEHWKEVLAMFALQWNVEDAKKVLYDEGVEDGFVKGQERGREVGREEGEDRFAALMTRLFQAGRAKDAQRAAQDPAFRKELYREFPMEEEK